MLQGAIQSARNQSSGVLATVIGGVTLLVTPSGVFGEMQSALNAIWKVKPTGSTVSRLIRARAASLGLVAALGFLLMVSLVMSAGIAALGDIINAYLPFGTLILSVLNAVISFLLISLLFAAIYKVLPDRRLEWRDVTVGAVVTAALFTLGKSLVGWYLGSSAVASAYGAAGALLIVFLWVYYSSEIFLLGAEFTRAYSLRIRTSNAPDRASEQHPNGGRALTLHQTTSGIDNTPKSSEVGGSLVGSPVLTIVAVVTLALAFVRAWRRARI